MPINTTVRARDTATGTSKMSPADQMVALFGFIGLHECAPPLEGLTAQAGRRGRKSPYPPLALLAGFLVAFQGLADVQSGTPYIPFALVGLAAWAFFQAHPLR